MRQAGRSLPEYRAERGTGSILDAIKQPTLAAELTLQPVRRYGVDAAILFSDIVVPLAAVGFGVDVEPGRGPVVARPFAGERPRPPRSPSTPSATSPTSSRPWASWSKRSAPKTCPSSAWRVVPSRWPAT